MNEAREGSAIAKEAGASDEPVDVFDLQAAFGLTKHLGCGLLVGRKIE